jgi:hypothetical protein
MEPLPSPRVSSETKSAPGAAAATGAGAATAMPTMARIAKMVNCMTETNINISATALAAL